MYRIKLSLMALFIAAAIQAGSPSLAAPVNYTFTTGPTNFTGAGLPFPAFDGLFGGASGTFFYDAQIPVAATNADGSFSYFAFTPVSMGGQPPSISGLSATVGTGAFPFSDANGSTQVGNDNFTGFGSLPMVDALILAFDPPAFAGSAFPRNVNGFELDGWKLLSVRMLWIESLAMTNEAGPPNDGVPIGDFLGNQALPGVLPDFSGRLWLEFQNIANPSLNSFVFFNNLRVTAAVPEPGTSALLLLAGIALLGFQARRRKTALRVPASGVGRR